MSSYAISPSEPIGSPRRRNSGTISPAPPPGARTNGRKLSLTPPREDRNVRPRHDDPQDGPRAGGTPPRPSRRGSTPPRPRSNSNKSRTPPRGNFNGNGNGNGQDRWAQDRGQQQGGGGQGQGQGFAPMGSDRRPFPAPRGRSPSPLRRTRETSPLDTPKFHLTLSLPHQYLASMLIGQGGQSSRAIQAYAGLSKLTFKGAGTGPRFAHERPEVEMRGSRQSIEDGVWAIKRKAKSHGEEVELNYSEADMKPLSSNGPRGSDRGPPPPREREREPERERPVDRPAERSATGGQSREWGRTETKDSNRDDRYAPAPASARSSGGPPAATSFSGKPDFQMEVPRRAISTLSFSTERLRTLAHVRVEFEAGSKPFIYIWGSKADIDVVVGEVDGLILSVLPTWRDAKAREQYGWGWDYIDFKAGGARGPNGEGRYDLDRAGAGRSAPPQQQGRRRSQSPPSRRRSPSPARRDSPVRSRRRSPSPRRDERDDERKPVPKRERERSPDPVAIGRYVASLTEDRRDQWTAEFVQASGLPYSEVKDEEMKIEE